jgi:hypothetical protein
MGKKFKIPPTKVNFQSTKIKPTPLPSEQKISFNFCRLTHKYTKFVYSDRDPAYFLKLLERLQNISGLTRKELATSFASTLRHHRIDFNDKRVSENSFGILSDDAHDDAWQLCLSQSEHGRIHGYFVVNTFYVVWLDPKHELYPGQN